MKLAVKFLPLIAFFGLYPYLADVSASLADSEPVSATQHIENKPIPATAVTVSKWNGYEKQAFTIAGHSAYVIVPRNFAPGRPWVWRTSFPDYVPTVDLELVSRGYHVGYIEILDLLGSDAALDLVDQFYAQVRSQWGLAEKMAVEPCSRGGLPAYRYAARHPERVACIYGDVPVMDFKSWPLKRPEKTTEWPKILQSYGFKNDAEAMAYRGNPIDELEPIAKAKIPIRHVICLNDKVVPPEANTLEAKRRLKTLGSDLEVVSVPQSNDSEGHHFPYPEVDASVRFIMDHSDVLPSGHEFFKLRDGLANCKAKFERVKTGRVAFLGGSITYNPGWHDEVAKYLAKRFPATKFEFITTGDPSCGSVTHAFRLRDDVLAKGPVDLLFFEAAVNDTTDILQSDASTNTLPEDCLLGAEGVVRQARLSNPIIDIVQIHFVQPEHIADYNAGKVPVAIGMHEKVAEAYGNPSVNFAEEVTARIAAGEMTWADYGDVHPSTFGQQLCTESLIRMLDAGFASAAGGSPKAHSIPAAPLDPRSFFKGRRIPAQKGAHDLKDFVAVEHSAGSWPGYVNLPTIETTTAGASFAFDFEGTACGLFIYAGPDTGIIEYSVDQGAWKKLDTFTVWSAAHHLPWALMLERELNPGKHNVSIKMATEHNKASRGSALRVMYLLEN